MTWAVSRHAGGGELLSGPHVVDQGTPIGHRGQLHRIALPVMHVGREMERAVVLDLPTVGRRYGIN